MYSIAATEKKCIWCFCFISCHMYQPDTVPPVPLYPPESINIYWEKKKNLLHQLYHMYQPDTVPPVPLYPPESINIYIERRKEEYLVFLLHRRPHVSTRYSATSPTLNQRVLIYIERRKEEYLVFLLHWRPHHVSTTLQRQNTEISKQIFPEKEYRGLSPKFHIHASVSDLYIPTIGLTILLEEICRPILGL